MQAWTITETCEGDTRTWAGLFPTREACEREILKKEREWGEYEQHPTVEWGEYEQHPTNERQGRVSCWTTGGTGYYELTRHV